MADEETGETSETVPRRKSKKKQGKREEDLEGLPVVVVEHSMTETELERCDRNSWMIVSLSRLFSFSSVYSKAMPLPPDIHAPSNIP